jgi:hypothetical protein
MIAHENKFEVIWSLTVFYKSKFENIVNIKVEYLVDEKIMLLFILFHICVVYWIDGVCICFYPRSFHYTSLGPNHNSLNLGLTFQTRGMC